MNIDRQNKTWNSTPNPSILFVTFPICNELTKKHSVVDWTEHASVIIVEAFISSFLPLCFYYLAYYSRTCIPYQTYSSLSRLEKKGKRNRQPRACVNTSVCQMSTCFCVRFFFSSILSIRLCLIALERLSVLSPSIRNTLSLVLFFKKEILETFYSLQKVFIHFSSIY